MFRAIEQKLRQRVRTDEAAVVQKSRPADSLWDHLQRVARVAEQLGHAEGSDPLLCRLGGLFHDAGKFAAGGNRVDARPEEERSVEVWRELAGGRLPAEQIRDVAEAIQQLYRDDPEPTPLARILFDADNLDKLGPLGVANYFVKLGLRGGGVSDRALRRLTVELTYARAAPEVLMTPTGRDLAKKRAAQTTAFVRQLLEALREDRIGDWRIQSVIFEGTALEVVEPERCRCGGPLSRQVWSVPGMKCSEIHLAHVCAACSDRQEIWFCRPRLIPS